MDKRPARMIGDESIGLEPDGVRLALLDQFCERTAVRPAPAGGFLGDFLCVFEEAHRRDNGTGVGKVPI